MLMRFRFKVLLALAALVMVGAGGYWGLPWCLDCPLPEPLPNKAVTDRNGVLLSLVAGADHYRQQPLPPEAELPPTLVRALVAAEDRRFFWHGGVDPLALARAAWDKLTDGPRSGGSTITMQLAKMLCGNHERTARAKVQEILLARQLEMRLSKEEILRAYLDRADFGNLCRGAETAAAFYYGKPAKELDTAEAALLVALVQAPSRLNPLRHPKAALHRRNLILTRMGQGEEMCEQPMTAAAHPLTLASSLRHEPGQLTLDAALQERCRLIAAEEVEKQRAHHMTQAAVVVLDNRSGDVLAAVGAALPHSEYGGQLDGTRMPRSAGSTLKPFVYLLSFEHGLWAGSVLADVPTLYRSPDGIQAPTDYNGHYRGPITVREALACSQNVPAMEALNDHGGVPAFLELLQRLGMHPTEEAGHYGLGLAIGNAHVTLTELVRAYACLARGGVLPEVHTRLPHGGTEGERIFTPEMCYVISDILSDRSARAAAFGSARNMRFPFRVACKTGTSSDFRDNWCIGYTADYTVGVWAGNFDNSSMQQVSGLSGAGPIFRRVMETLYEPDADGEPRMGRRPSFPERPSDLQEAEIDTRTGLLPTPKTPPECRRRELGLPTQLPTESGRYDEAGRALLDARFADWLAESGKKHLFAVNETEDGGRYPTILIPAHGTTLVLDPTLPQGGSLAELRSTLPPAVAEWSCPTLRLSRRNGTWYAELRPGTHTLQVRDTKTGRRAQATFTVEER